MQTVLGLVDRMYTRHYRAAVFCKVGTLGPVALAVDAQSARAKADPLQAIIRNMQLLLADRSAR
jgi:hypothetical protein